MIRLGLNKMNEDKTAKKQLIGHLTSNPEYVRCLESIADPEERRKVKAFTEEIFVNIFGGLASLHRFAELAGKKVVKSEQDISKK